MAGVPGPESLVNSEVRIQYSESRILNESLRLSRRRFICKYILILCNIIYIIYINIFT